MARQLVCSLLLVALTVLPGEASWSYSGNNGPEHWKKLFPECGGRRQSPVNINTHDEERDDDGGSWPRFHFHNFNTIPNSMTILNTGESAQVSSEQLRASVSGGALGAEYTFLQFHFHWGSSNKLGGSEHTVNHRREAAELHMVFFKTEYGNFKESLNYRDGVAVFAVFLRLSRHDNANLRTVVAGLSSIRHHNDTAHILPIPLSAVLPPYLTEFYRYYGSFTTPDCNEVVTWTVFKHPITISSTQLKKFRSLVFEDGKPMQDNFRPVQPLNGRKIYQRPKGNDDS
ncbi:carbonic anhydrase 2-like [Homarus americanus]|uniref:carbonic anhydrase 2-like n=1 Tax=Homarus americanus TaxID=6706 RepID=UPI001C44FA41|nr:carbonic anhydrase 2-like [Homarus americanus]